jgi:uncharacterized protein (TIGR02599 family)
MVLVLSTVEQTQRVWSRAQSKVSQFQSARNAFDSLTRRLSQATLNTYYRAFDQDITTETAAFAYTRESELHFLTGPTAKIMTSPMLKGISDDANTAYPTHGIFFMAPLGYTQERDKSISSTYVARFRNLNSALTATGYFIEHGEDPDVPKSLRDAGLIPSKKRFRLMELDVPTENLSIYRRPLDGPVGGSGGSDLRKYRNDPQILNENKVEYVGMIDRIRRPTENWIRPLWMEEALSRKTDSEGSGEAGYHFENARVLAENIVALIIVPKLAQKDREVPGRMDDLAPYFMYDSLRVLAVDPAFPMRAARYNQLPPIVQVTMIAVDEPSAQRLADRYKDELPNWSENMFQRLGTEDELRQQIQDLEKKIAKDPTKPTYRTFSTDVVIRGSKWSRDANLFIFDQPPKK